MDNNQIKISKKMNVGIELLRFLLCLWIVIAHCSKIKNEHKKFFGRGFQVPAFILISFYFFYPVLEQRKIAKIIIRFQRLLIPYIIWPLVFFVIKNYIIKNISSDKLKTYPSFYDIYIQILTGTR